MKRIYTPPKDTDIPTLKRQAAKRRAALVAAGCSTYALGYRNGVPGILCLCCGLGSSNVNDIEEKFCGFCHSFHSDWREEQTNAKP